MNEHCGEPGCPFCGPPVVLVDLSCGCQDVIYPDGTVDREHDHVVCDGLPEVSKKSE